MRVAVAVNGNERMRRPPGERTRRNTVEVRTGGTSVGAVVEPRRLATVTPENSTRLATGAVSVSTRAGVGAGRDQMTGVQARRSGRREVQTADVLIGLRARRRSAARHSSCTLRRWPRRPLTP